MKHKILAAYILIVMLILTGCGGSDGEPSTDAGSGEESTQLESAQPEQTPEETPEETPVEENGTGSPGSGGGLPGSDAGSSGEAGMNDNSSQGQTIFNPDGTFSIDTNGDGVIDMYMDADGNMYMDIDGDGIPEKVESEFSDG